MSASNIDFRIPQQGSGDGSALICQRARRSGMNSLQPLTIHTSAQIRPLVATRKLFQMYVLQAQSALTPPRLPPATGTEVFKPCQPLLLSSSNRSCTQVVTFLYGRRSLGAGRRPEGKAEVDYRSGERGHNLQNKLGSEACACSSGSGSAGPVCSP